MYAGLVFVIWIQSVTLCMLGLSLLSGYSLCMLGLSLLSGYSSVYAWLVFVIWIQFCVCLTCLCYLDTVCVCLVCLCYLDTVLCMLGLSLLFGYSSVYAGLVCYLDTV